MVYAHTVNRITLSGKMWGGAEEWSTGFFLGQEGADAQELSQAGLDQIRDAFGVFFSHGLSWISNQYSFDQAKSALIDATGHTILDSVKYSYKTSGNVGGTTSGHFPSQCSLVVTLQSDRPRGIASKGRMYLPGIAGGVNGAGKLDSDRVNSIANNLKTFFDSFANDADVPDQLILAGKAKSALLAGTAQNDYVETFKVGDVVDTQRRRRNGLSESYQTRVLV
jgi:hypothetical protein